MHRHLLPSQAWLKQRPFPTYGSVVRTIIGNMASSDFSASLPQTSLSAYTRAYRGCGAPDQPRPPLLHSPLSPHSVPLTPGSSSRLLFQILHLFLGLRLVLTGSALPPNPYRRCRIPFHSTDCRVALPSRSTHPRFSTTSRPGHRRVATWLSGNYHDRTFTGKRTAPCKAHQHAQMFTSIAPH